MSSIDSFTAAFEGLRQSRENGRLAHAYLIVGSSTGNGLAFAESFLQLMLCREKRNPCGSCPECARVRAHSHPDVMWMEPESKSRKIVIGDEKRIGIRDMNRFIAVSPLMGLHKVGVLLHADRMTEQAQNAFLKTLEEPSGTSLLLLVTDAVHRLLPTIVSRCQRIVLSGVRDDSEKEWYEPLLEILREGFPRNALQATAQAGRLKALLDRIKKKVEAEEQERARSDAEARADGSKEEKETFEARVKSRVNEARADIMRCMLLWRRDVLVTVLGTDPSVIHHGEEADVIRRQASGLTYSQALGQLNSVEGMIRQFEKNLPDDTVLHAGLRGAGTAPRSWVDSPPVD